MIPGVLYIQHHAICEDSFTSSSPMRVPFISLSCSIAWASADTVLEAAARTHVLALFPPCGKTHS